MLTCRVFEGRGGSGNYVSLIINKFQFLVLCLLKSREVNKNLKYYFLLGSLFLFPLERLAYIMEVELTMSLKHISTGILLRISKHISLANVLNCYWSKQFKTFDYESTSSLFQIYTNEFSYVKKL